MIIWLLLIRYNKLADLRDNKLIANGNSVDGNGLVEDMVYAMFFVH